MKKHNLYFEIKKNPIFSQLSFLSKSFYALRRWIDKIVINLEINNPRNLIELISETLNFIFFFNFVSIIQVSVI